jgi:Ca2+/Na+ antiporter
MDKVFYPSKRIKNSAKISVVFVLFFFAMSIFIIKDTYLIAFFGVSTLYLLIVFYQMLSNKLFVKINDNAIKVSSLPLLFIKQNRVKWDEITEFNYSINNGLLLLTIYRRHGKKVLINGYNDMDFHKAFLSKLSFDKDQISQTINELNNSLIEDQKRVKRKLYLSALLIVIPIFVLVIAIVFFT